MSTLLQQILAAACVAAALVYLAVRYFRSRKKPGCPHCAVFKGTIRDGRSGR